MISWFNRNQLSVELSTTEAEYIGACSTSSKVVWLRKLMLDLFDLELEVTCIFYDNQNCVKFPKNPVFHDKSKHIDIKYHYIQDMVQRGVVNLKYMGEDEQTVVVL